MIDLIRVLDASPNVAGWALFTFLMTVVLTAFIYRTFHLLLKGK